MNYQQARPLVEELMNIAVLYHAAPMQLRTKIYAAVDKHIPDLDEGCKERGCMGIDNFKEKV